MSIGKAFDKSVDYYDDWMRKALPDYDTIFGIAQDLIPYNTSDQIEVLDLGAGTGLFSKQVFDKFPQARFTLYDLAEQMLGLAKKRFNNNSSQFNYVLGDYKNVDGIAKFNLVISSLSIHHLTHEEKRRLFRSIHQILKIHGLFINIDQIRGETDPLQELYWTRWLSHVRKSGAAEEQILQSIDRRKKYDIDATMEEQLQWLREAEYTQVDCVYKNYFIGIFLAQK